jgi:hypothetical protein
MLCDAGTVPLAMAERTRRAVRRLAIVVVAGGTIHLGLVALAIFA